MWLFARAHTCSLVVKYMYYIKTQLTYLVVDDDMATLDGGDVVMLLVVWCLLLFEEVTCFF